MAVSADKNTQKSKADIKITKIFTLYKIISILASYFKLL